MAVTLAKGYPNTTRCMRRAGPLISTVREHARRNQKALSAQQRKVYAVLTKRGTLADFAGDLSDVSGESVTWERVWSWVLRGSVSRRMVPHVHRLTRVPLST